MFLLGSCSKTHEPETSSKSDTQENAVIESEGPEAEVPSESEPATADAEHYGPEIYGVRFGMPMSMVEKILHGNSEIQIIKGEEATPAGRQPRLDYYDPLNIHVRPKDCRPYSDKYIFTGEEKALSKITLTCSDDTSDYDFCLDCVSPMDTSPEFEEHSTERIEYHTVVEKRKAFHKIGSRVLELEHSIWRSDVSGENYTLSVFPQGEYPPRLIVEPMKVITPMNKAVEFSAKGWDPVTGELPEITWEPVVAGEPAESGPQITRLWQEPGTFNYVVMAQGANGLEIQVQIEVDVTNHRYSENAIGIVEAISEDLLLEDFMSGWGQTLTFGGQDVATEEGGQKGMQTLEFPTLLEKIEHADESKLYVKQGKFAGYKLVLRTPSREYQEIYSSLLKKLGPFDPIHSTFFGDEYSQAQNYLMDSGDFYIKMKHDALKDYGPMENRENKYVLEVLYKQLWEKEEVVELGSDWESLMSKLE
jgi:hypothetical protein